MMETIRSRNGHTQPAFGYGSGTYDGIQFSDPWARTSAPMSSHIMAAAIPSDSSILPSMSRPMRNSLSSPFNTSISLDSRQNTSPPMYQTDIFPSNEMMSKFAPSTYAEPTSAPLVTAGSGGYAGMGGYGSSSYEQMQSRNNLYSLQPYQTDRRLSHPSISSSSFLGSPVELRQRQNSLIDYQRSQPNSGSYTSNARDGSLNDALDSARGMMALSQTDTRLPLVSQHRNSSSASSYYPASTTSSISSTGSYPYFGSMDSSSTELSSTDGLYDSGRPSLPRPAGMVQSHGMPHQSGAQAMMSTFSSRVSSSTQKKHKCKICDKRFTRPSSLQTHMYSHTGEKPYMCDVDGCGRQFSVVSNLRRHRKVHKGLPDMDTCSNASG